MDKKEIEVVPSEQLGKNMTGAPFITVFNGDPAQMFYCADRPKTYELTPQTKRYPGFASPLERLKRYVKRQVTIPAKPVLIWRAGETPPNDVAGYRQSEI